MPQDQTALQKPGTIYIHMSLIAFFWTRSWVNFSSLPSQPDKGHMALVKSALKFSTRSSFSSQSKHLAVTPDTFPREQRKGLRGMEWVKVEVLKRERVNMEVQSHFSTCSWVMRNSGLKNGPKQNSSAFTLSLTQSTVTESEHKGCFVVSLLQKRRREIKRLAQGHTAGKCHSEYQDHKEPMTHGWQTLSTSARFLWCLSSQPHS